MIKKFLMSRKDSLWEDHRHLRLDWQMEMRLLALLLKFQMIYYNSYKLSPTRVGKKKINKVRKKFQKNWDNMKNTKKIKSLIMK